jgi:putative metalloenzyme radical SAM/SPASM domain maturase
MSATASLKVIPPASSAPAAREPAGPGPFAAHPAAREFPSKLFVEVTTRCNLRCPMCAKRVPGSGIGDGDLSEETFARLAPAFPTLDTLILNGIGEPLLHPRLEPFIREARRAMPAGATIAFQTNGTLLGADRAEGLVRSGVDRVCVSLDALSPQLLRTIRPGADVDRVERAFANLAAAKRRLGSASPSVGLEFVLMRGNFAELPDLVTWAARHEVSFILVTQMMPYHPSGAAGAIHPTSSDRAIALFEEWNARAAAEGVDLGRYYDVFMKFRRSPEDEKIFAYASRLFEDAHRQGILLRMDDLLARDRTLQRGVEEAVREAEARAKALGISIALPRLAPNHQRRCDFVEEGGAFVSWDGKVHPCYYLWHGYRCYLGGVEKQVKPAVLGDLASQDILEAWNGDAFRRFRQNVLKYDYPFCYDCNVALCDYAQAEDFEQDCYLRTVPCGACLWSTGLFHCLR